VDLERLKDDEEWLSDTHVVFGLLFVHRLFFNFFSFSTEQGLFSGLCSAQYLGGSENQALGHKRLANVN
jgi:hypothetical protein